MKEKIKICSSYYDVVYKKIIRNEDDKLLMGHIDGDMKLIRVCSRFPKQSQLQTKFHESVHGIFNEYNLDETEDEVIIFSNAFYAFIVDNVDFIKEILRCAEGIKK